MRTARTFTPQRGVRASDPWRGLEDLAYRLGAEEALAQHGGVGDAGGDGADGRRGQREGLGGPCIVLAFPVLLYLTMTPRFQYLGPVGLIGLALATWRVSDAPRAAILALALPAFGLLVLLAVQLLVR